MSNFQMENGGNCDKYIVFSEFEFLDFSELSSVPSYVHRVCTSEYKYG